MPLDFPSVPPTCLLWYMRRVVPSGTRVIEQQLALIRDSNMPRVHGHECWIVSVIPAGGIYMPSVGPPGRSKRVTGTYELLFVDAESGHFIYGIIGQ